MPEPAAISTCDRPGPGRPNVPEGAGPRSLTRPDLVDEPRREHPVRHDPHPTRGAAPTAAQMEYCRRSSRSPTWRRSVSDWPAVNRKSSARSSGTSNVTAAASSQSRSTRATRSGWKVPRPDASAPPSDLLHVVEGLAAGAAGVQRSTRGRAEWDTSWVSAEPHCVQMGGRDGIRIRSVGPSFGRGGEMPCSASASRPRGLIQSDDHAGVSVVRTSASSKPARCRATSTSARIVASAGSRCRSA